MTTKQKKFIYKIGDRPRNSTHLLNLTESVKRRVHSKSTSFLQKIAIIEKGKKGYSFSILYSPPYL